MSRQVQHPFVLPMHACMIIVSKSEPFDGKSKVEIKFELSPCHGTKGGQLYLIVSPDDAGQLSVGQEFNNIIKRIN